jgi:hypothetical protein
VRHAPGWAVAAGVAAVAVAIGLATRARAPRSAAPDPLAGLDPEASYQRAIAIATARDPIGSVPYFRHALGAGQDAWKAHYNYGSALYNSTLQIHTRLGVPQAVTRSSHERAVMMREAIAELQTAEAMAPTPADVATVRAARARMLMLWGLPWEAFTALRQAQQADPRDPHRARVGDMYMEILEHPERPGYAPEP